MGWRSLGARSAGTASPGLAIPGLEPAAPGAPALRPHARGCPAAPPSRGALRPGLCDQGAARASVPAAPAHGGRDQLRARALGSRFQPHERAPSAETPPSPARAAAPMRPRLGRIADFQTQRDARAGRAVLAPTPHHRLLPAKAAGHAGDRTRAARGGHPARRLRARAGREGWRDWRGGTARLRASGGAGSRRHARSLWLPRPLFSGRARAVTLGFRSAAAPPSPPGIPVRASKGHEAPLFRHRHVHEHGVYASSARAHEARREGSRLQGLCGDTVWTVEPAGGTEATELPASYRDATAVTEPVCGCFPGPRGRAATRATARDRTDRSHAVAAAAAGPPDPTTLRAAGTAGAGGSAGNKLHRLERKCLHQVLAEQRVQQVAPQGPAPEPQGNCITAHRACGDT